MVNHHDNRRHLIAYLADWGDWDGDLLDVTKLTRLNYAFALVSNHRVTGDSLKKAHWIKTFKNRNPSLKALISIGGWGADGFSDAALTESSRTHFSETAVSLLDKYGFDGIDVDWEYPCRDYAGIVARREDRENFTLLMTTLREHLDKHGQRNGCRYLLTIAAGASKVFADDMELSQLVPLLDTVNLMTYDFYTTGPQPGHHTNLYPSHNPNTGCSKAVEVFLNAGVPAEKIVLGAAFYGRGWSGLAPQPSPFSQTGQSGISHPYAEIKHNIINRDGFQRYWDDAAKAPYLFNGNTFITYDDPQSLTHKVRYILEKGLAGIMFWEWSEDGDNELLDTLYNGLMV